MRVNLFVILASLLTCASCTFSNGDNQQMWTDSMSSLLRDMKTKFLEMKFDFLDKGSLSVGSLWSGPGNDRRSDMSNDQACQAFGAAFFNFQFKTTRVTWYNNSCPCAQSESLPGIPSRLPQGSCISSNSVSGGIYPVPVDVNGNQLFSKDTYFCKATGCGIPFFTPTSATTNGSDTVVDRSMLCLGLNASAPCFQAVNVTPCLVDLSLEPRSFPAGCSLSDYSDILGRVSSASDAEFSKLCAMTGPTSNASCGIDGAISVLQNLLSNRALSDCRPDIFFPSPAGTPAIYMGTLSADVPQSLQNIVDLFSQIGCVKEGGRFCFPVFATKSPVVLTPNATQADAAAFCPCAARIIDPLIRVFQIAPRDAVNIEALIDAACSWRPVPAATDPIGRYCLPSIFVTMQNQSMTLDESEARICGDPCLPPAMTTLMRWSHVTGVSLGPIPYHLAVDALCAVNPAPKPNASGGNRCMRRIDWTVTRSVGPPLYENMLARCNMTTNYSAPLDLFATFGAGFYGLPPSCPPDCGAALAEMAAAWGCCLGNMAEMYAFTGLGLAITSLQRLCGGPVNPLLTVPCPPPPAMWNRSFCVDLPNLNYSYVLAYWDEVATSVRAAGSLLTGMVPGRIRVVSSGPIAKGNGSSGAWFCLAAEMLTMEESDGFSMLVAAYADSANRTIRFSTLSGLPPSARLNPAQHGFQASLRRAPLPAGGMSAADFNTLTVAQLRDLLANVPTGQPLVLVSGSQGQRLALLGGVSYSAPVVVAERDRADVVRELRAAAGSGAGGLTEDMLATGFAALGVTVASADSFKPLKIQLDYSATRGRRAAGQRALLESVEICRLNRAAASALAACACPAMACDGTVSCTTNTVGAPATDNNGVWVAQRSGSLACSSTTAVPSKETTSKSLQTTTPLPQMNNAKRHLTLDGPVWLILEVTIAVASMHWQILAC